MPKISDNVILANHNKDQFHEPLDGCESRYPVQPCWSGSEMRRGGCVEGLGIGLFG